MFFLIWLWGYSVGLLEAQRWTARRDTCLVCRGTKIWPADEPGGEDEPCPVCVGVRIIV